MNEVLCSLPVKNKHSGMVKGIRGIRKAKLFPIFHKQKEISFSETFFFFSHLEAITVVIS